MKRLLGFAVCGLIASLAGCFGPDEPDKSSHDSREKASVQMQPSDEDEGDDR